MSPLVRFAVQSFLSYKALSWGGVSAYVWNRIIRPVLFVTMFAFMGRFAGDPSAAEAYIVGMAAVAIAATILDGILPMFTIERGAAVLAFLFVSSANRLVILSSRAVIHLVNGWVSVAISLLFAGVFLKLDFSRVDWVTLVVAILAISLSSTAFALFAGNFSLLLREWTDLSALLQGSVVAFTGAVIPVARLPGLLGAIGHALPLTAGLVAFRAAFQGAPVGAVAAPLAGEATVALAYAALSALVFAAVERHAKRLGSLDWEAA